MGDRSQIAVRHPTKNDPDACVFLYGHWSGTEIYKALQNALHDHPGRWDDSEYLTRLIARAMGMGCEGETGFGIGTSLHGDIEHPVPLLDCSLEQITFLDSPLGFYKKPEICTHVISFKEFTELPSDHFEEW